MKLLPAAWTARVGAYALGALMSACAVTGVGVGVGVDEGYGYGGVYDNGYAPYGYDYGGWGGRYRVGPPRGDGPGGGPRGGEPHGGPPGGGGPRGGFGGGGHAPSIPSGPRGGGGHH